MGNDNSKQGRDKNVSAVLDTAADFLCGSEEADKRRKKKGIKKGLMKVQGSMNKIKKSLDSSFHKDKETGSSYKPAPILNSRYGTPYKERSNNDKSDSEPVTNDNNSYALNYEDELDISLHSRASTSSSFSTRELRSSRCGMRRTDSAIGLDIYKEERKMEGDVLSNIVNIEVPFGRPIEETYDGVHGGTVLGSGISGIVRLCTHKLTGVKYAVKCLDLGLLETDQALEQLRNEIYIMCSLDHPNIVRLEEVYESLTEIYLVMELCHGGELYDRLEEQPDYHYTEEECAYLVKQMLSALRYLHSKGIVHRDMKLENFLFASKDVDSELKMIDFGLSKYFTSGEVQNEAVGTPYTVAPEVLQGQYDERCDLWAIGVITYLLLSGEPPFGGCGGPECMMQVRAKILSADYDYKPKFIWKHVSRNAKAFIDSLLVTDPTKRASIAQAQKSSWMTETAAMKDHEAGTTLNPGVVSSLVGFKEYSDMRKLLCEVLSFTLLPEQIKELRKEFEKLDNGSGEISLSSLRKVLSESAGSGDLGALTEEEVEDIFDAMRVRKSDTKIHWHEFIAAGLSQCEFDERNLRLAFERLDSDHAGHITLNNVMDMMGSSGVHNSDGIREMFEETLKSINSEYDHITYEDFVLLMKGQLSDNNEHSATDGVWSSLDTVTERDDETFASDNLTNSNISGMESYDNGNSGFCMGRHLLEEKVKQNSENAHKECETRTVTTCSASNYSTNNNSLSTDNLYANSSPDKSSAHCHSRGGHRRSFSSPANPENEVILEAEAQNTLTNKHRQLRRGVIEASKMFEEKQSKRIMKAAALQMSKEAKNKGSGAVLITIHGQSKELAEKVHGMMKERKFEQQNIIKRGCRKSGRGRHNRKKVVSDLSVMLSSPFIEDENMPTMLF